MARELLVVEHGDLTAHVCILTLELLVADNHALSLANFVLGLLHFLLSFVLDLSVFILTNKFIRLALVDSLLQAFGHHIKSLVDMLLLTGDLLDGSVLLLEHRFKNTSFKVVEGLPDD